MKKILHITKYYYPYYGGIEDVTNTLVEELKGHYEQKIICFSKKKKSTYNLNDVEVISVRSLFEFMSQPIAVNYKKILRKTVDNFRPDYVHVHFPNPLVAAILLSVNLHGAKIIVHWHADILGKPIIYSMIKPFEKRVLQKAYKIIATSRIYADFSEPLKPYQNKIVILPNTINAQKLDLQSGEDEKVKAIKKQFADKKIVFFVGRHVAYKGIKYLINADQFIDENCVILIAGNGKGDARLKQLARGKERILFIGRLPNRDLRCYLHAADVFAFPSCNRSEAFGVALAEALYCGVPAVSFDIKGSGALWVNQNNRTGFVVENRNVKAFGEAISNILYSDHLRKELSHHAVEWVNAHFLKNQILPVMEEIYS